MGIVELEFLDLWELNYRNFLFELIRNRFEGDVKEWELGRKENFIFNWIMIILFKGRLYYVKFYVYVYKFNI